MIGGNLIYVKAKALFPEKYVHFCAPITVATRPIFTHNFWARRFIVGDKLRMILPNGDIRVSRISEGDRAAITRPNKKSDFCLVEIYAANDKKPYYMAGIHKSLLEVVK